jgi:hypothetical protein
VTIFGWDMSHYDAPSVGSAVAEGISFITHKAGGDSDDAEIGAWWSGVKNLDPSVVLLGAYWVLYPGDPSGRADAFVSRLDATCPGWRDRPFLLQVDCEKWNGNSATEPGKADIKAFCDRLVARMPKLRPVVYAPQWVYGNALAGLGYSLWASSYVTGTGGFKSLYPGDSSSHWGAYSGQTPAILQYTSSAVIGGQSTSDANAYRGTLAELIDLAAPGWSAEMASVWDEDVIPVQNKTATWVAGGTLGATFDAAVAADAQARSNGSALSVLSAKVDALAAQVTNPPVISQAQLDLAVLNALKTFAGGQG